MKNLNHSSLRTLTVALGLVFGVLAVASGQTFSTWDLQANNPQNPYTGSLSGLWEGSFWDTTDQLGTASPTTWVEGTTALFAVNTGTGTPAFLVTMNSGHMVAGIYDGGETPGPCPVTINGTGAMTLPAGSQIFNIVSPGTLTISNVITGSGSLVQSGTGTLTLDGVNTYTGGTAIGSGSTLTIGGAGKLGNGTYAAGITNTGTFNYNSSASQTLSGIVSGSGGAVTVSKGTLSLSKANSYNGGTTIASGATLTLASGGTLNGSSAITNNGTFNYNNPASWTLSGVLSGSGGLTVNPGGVGGSLLTLSGANTYTGATTIAPLGQVIISSDSNLGTPPGSYTAGQLSLFYGFLKATASFTLNANRGIKFVNQEAGVGGSIQVNPGCTLTIAGPITGPYAWICGSGEATFGGGTNLLATTNGYTGGTALSSGRLLLGTNGALPSGTTMIMAPDDFGGPFFDLGGYNQTIGPLSTTNTFAPPTVGNGTPTIVLSGALTVLETNTTTVFSGLITGSGSLTISGNSSGRLILSNYANAYTGGTLITGGTLEVGPGGSSIGGIVSINAGATNQLDNNTALSANTVLNLAPGASVNLNYSGTPQTISALNFGVTPQATGLWGAVGNAGATFTSSQFTGSGLLLVCPTPDQTITAASSVCAGTTNTASVPVTAGATYAWSVTNATIVSGGTSSTLTYAVSALSPVILNCVATSTCGAQSAGGQNTNVVVNTCWQVVESTNVVYNSQTGATITGTGLIGAGWSLNVSSDLSAPLPWPTLESGTVMTSPFTVIDNSAIFYPQQFYYLTNSP